MRWSTVEPAEVGCVCVCVEPAELSADPLGAARSARVMSALCTRAHAAFSPAWIIFHMENKPSTQVVDAAGRRSTLPLPFICPQLLLLVSQGSSDGQLLKYHVAAQSRQGQVAQANQTLDMVLRFPSGPRRVSGIGGGITGSSCDWIQHLRWQEASGHVTRLHNTTA